VALAKQIQDYAAVQAWLQGLREQWSEEPNDWEERLEALAGFCAFAEKDPDTVIKECVRESEAGKRISVKGRRFYNDKIAEWQASLPGDRSAQGRAGNAVRSFLIHNGIFIQSGMQA
jgi:hypothetical protein